MSAKNLAGPSIRDLFHRAYNGHRNFMTPVIHEVGQRGRFVYELSSGDIFGPGEVWGVTVLTVDGERTSLSQAFTNKAAAENYISSLSGPHEAA